MANMRSRILLPLLLAIPMAAQVSTPTPDPILPLTPDDNVCSEVPEVGWFYYSPTFGVSFSKKSCLSAILAAKGRSRYIVMVQI